MRTLWIQPTEPAGLNLLGSVITDQRWGVRAAARDGEPLLGKDGWMTWDDQDGQWSINGIGRITGTDTDLTLAVLTTGQTDMESGVALVEAVCATIRDTPTP